MYTGSIQSPLVSVIVINFNYGRFLEQCLLSILGQTYPFIECIVIDNASTDNSCAVLDSFAENGAFAVAGRSLEIIASDRNLYQTPAAAEAFKRCTGPFVIFFDADDLMLPTCVEAHVRAILSLRTPVGVSCVDFLISTGDHLSASSCTGFSNAVATAPCPDTVFRHVELPPTSRGQDLDLKMSELHLLDRQTATWSWSSTCGLCFRRELVELLFRRIPRVKAQLDAYLVFGISSLAGSVLIDRPLAIYRHHGANLFACGPNAANFKFYDSVTNTNDVRTTAAEAIESLTFSSKYLARYLWKSIYFIEAVETIGKLGMIDPSLPVGSFKLSYILENEGALVEAFGESEVHSWISEATTGRRDSLFVKEYRGSMPNKERGTSLRQAAGYTMSETAGPLLVDSDPVR